MSEYLIKVSFWLHAYDSVTVEAETDEEALFKAKSAAVTLMQSQANPEAIDTDERCQGIIAYVDRISPGARRSIAEDVVFDDDRIGLVPDPAKSSPPSVVGTMR